jgi:magnesium transporter
MRADAGESIVDSLTHAELLTLFTDIDANTLVELQDIIPDHHLETVLAKMDETQLSHYSAAQQFNDDEVGHWCAHQSIVWCRSVITRGRVN